MQLMDKVVFVTGGAQGFGRSVAEAVLKKGAKVCIADVQVEQGEKSTKELQSSYGQDNVMFVRCDVTDAAVLEGAFKTAITKFGQIDVMCNNAGILDESVWEKQIDINFNGVVRGTMLAINHMRKDKGGKGGVIINTSSLTGLCRLLGRYCFGNGSGRTYFQSYDHRLIPFWWFPVYAGTKSAVQHFTNSWAQNPEMKAAEIRFASICPSGVNTALMDLKEHQVINLKNFMEQINQMGYSKIEHVVEAFMKVIEDDDLNGALLTITPKQGVECMKLSLVPST